MLPPSAITARTASTSRSRWKRAWGSFTSLSPPLSRVRVRMTSNLPTHPRPPTPLRALPPLSPTVTVPPVPNGDKNAKSISAARLCLRFIA